MNYFISDLHFGHRAIIKQCSRPFSSVEEMDEALISNWNRKVKGNDTVYILGDFSHKSDHEPAYYLSRLKGRKVLILGNHDGERYREKPLSDLFLRVADMENLTIDRQHITLCHYPMLEWKNSRKEGSRKLGYLIHGHIHTREDALYDSLFSLPNALNAAAELNGYAPVTFDELLANNERHKLSKIKAPLEQARFLCRSYHKHQCDKAGEAYYHHPFRVAEGLVTEEEQIVALLHDTLEDTSLSPALISELFGERILGAVLAMTHKEGEDYFTYLARLKENSLSRAVKLSDLAHNMDLSRLKTVTEADLLRVEKYKKAVAFLERLG